MEIINMANELNKKKLFLCNVSRHLKCHLILQNPKNKMESCLCLNKSNQTPKSQFQIIVMHIENKNKCSSFFFFLVKWNKCSKAYIPINKLNKIQSQHKLQDHKFKVNNHSNTFPHTQHKSSISTNAQFNPIPKSPIFCQFSKIPHHKYSKQNHNKN